MQKVPVVSIVSSYSGQSSRRPGEARRGELGNEQNGKRNKHGGKKRKEHYLKLSTAERRETTTATGAELRAAWHPANQHVEIASRGISAGKQSRPSRAHQNNDRPQLAVHLYGFPATTHIRTRTQTSRSRRARSPHSNEPKIASENGPKPTDI